MEQEILILDNSVEPEEVVQIIRSSKGKNIPVLNSSLAKTGVMKLQAITTELNFEFVERDHIVRDMILALVSQQHMLLLGPPGTARRI